MDKISIYPKAKKADITIEAPGSKSITNRALIISSLAEGMSILKNVSNCDDALLMIKALKELGITIKEAKTNELHITGTSGRLKVPSRALYVDNAGTTMRFLCSFVTFAKGEVILRGDRRMLKRPIDDLLVGMRQMGIEASKNGADIEIESRSSFPGGAIKISGKKSSQFISSLLMCGPYAKRVLSIEIIDKLVSKPYLSLTIDMMTDFGAEIKIRNGCKRLLVSNRQRYIPREYTIEGDCSGASYFWAAAAITGGRVRVTNINPRTRQGDIKFVTILEKMGCKARYGNDFVEVCGGDLNGIDIDMNHIPDVVPTLAVVALFASGKTTIRNVPHLRDKESDRIGQFSQELTKLGAKVFELKDGLIIKPDVKSLHSTIFNSHNDHRLAMSFSLLGLKFPIELKNPSCVKKSFPDFFDRFKKLGEVA